MSKITTKFVCQACGQEFRRWQGKCDQCGEWNSLVETVVQTRAQSSKLRTQRITTQKLSEVSDLNFKRTQTGILEFDRVLGGGIVPGSLILIGGDPGIGKSTLGLQVAAQLVTKDKQTKVLYISGEESINQIKIRASRLKTDSSNLLVVSETNIEGIIDLATKEKPNFLIVDSIQTMYSEELMGMPGNVGQVSFCANRLMELAKKESIATFIIGHVTKEGSVAGPRVLEHLVDVVLYLEGERYGGFRILRGVKNRFGSTNEVGIFEMTEIGLIEISNPSASLLEERIKDASGSVVLATMEGTRPLLVEVQALTSTTSFGYPKRAASGVDLNRLNLLIAVLQKRLGYALQNQDSYVNIVGGLKIREPAVDLAIIVALTSAYKNKKVYQDLIVFGEVGLSGEIRKVSNVERRLKEAEKLGFKRSLTAKRSAFSKSETKIKVLEARTIKEAIEMVLT